MDQLSSCYFCGASLDASLSEYPVVPKQLQPDEAERRTVVLCPTCRRKLATIVESVVAAAETDLPEQARSVDEDDQSDIMDESGIESQPDPMDLSDANESDDGTLLGGGADDEAIESASNGRDEVAESDAESVAKSDAEAGEDSDTNSDRGLTRLEYSKVMRLLQNRELPVDRRGFREVATSAYDIEDEQFDAIIDAAIERDLIGEEDGQLVSAE